MWCCPQPVPTPLIVSPHTLQEEDIDRVHDDDNMWSLPGVQAALLEAVVATGTPTVLVRCDGGCDYGWRRL